MVEKAIVARSMKVQVSCTCKLRLYFDPMIHLANEHVQEFCSQLGFPSCAESFPTVIW